MAVEKCLVTEASCVSERRALRQWGNFGPCVYCSFSIGLNFQRVSQTPIKLHIVVSIGFKTKEGLKLFVRAVTWEGKTM